MTIPVIINARDRLTCLRELVGWLEAAELDRIVILDNASTYEPLLEWYETIPYQVIRLGKNLGKMALWTSGHVPANEYFVYTDPDIIPLEECPLDAVERLRDLLNRHPHQRAGLGLYLDDLPATMPWLGWERQVQAKAKVLSKGPPAVYDTTIDTTFAVCRPRCAFRYPALRTGWPYVARHTSWYTYADGLSEEDEYYLSHAAHGPLASTWATQASPRPAYAAGALKFY